MAGLQLPELEKQMKRMNTDRRIFSFVVGAVAFLFGFFMGAAMQQIPFVQQVSFALTVQFGALGIVLAYVLFLPLMLPPAIAVIWTTGPVYAFLRRASWVKWTFTASWAVGYHLWVADIPLTPEGGKQLAGYVTAFAQAIAGFPVFPREWRKVFREERTELENQLLRTAKALRLKHNHRDRIAIAKAIVYTGLGITEAKLENLMMALKTAQAIRSEALPPKRRSLRWVWEVALVLVGAMIPGILPLPPLLLRLLMGPLP